MDDTRFTPPSAEKVVDGLTWANKAPFSAFFKQSEHEQGEGAALAQIIAYLRPGLWEQDKNWALQTAVREALDKVEGTPKGSRISYREIAEILCGFRASEIPPKENGTRLGYNEYLAFAKERSGLSDAESTLRRKAWTPTRRRLAQALLSLQPRTAEAVVAEYGIDSATPPFVPLSASEPQRVTQSRRSPRRGHILSGIALVVCIAGVASYVWIRHDPGPDPDPIAVDGVKFIGLEKGNYVFPGTVQLSSAQLAKLDNENYGKDKTFYAWFTKRQGVPADGMTVSFTLRGTLDKQVEITDAQLDKRNCRAPLTNDTLFMNGGSNAGGGKTRTMFFKLDEPGSTATNEDGEEYFAKDRLFLKKDETEVIVAYISTYERYCDFGIKLTVAIPGKGAVPQTLTNNGALFSLTPSATNEGSDYPYRGHTAIYVGGVAAPVETQGGLVAADPRKYTGGSESITPP